MDKSVNLHHSCKILPLKNYIYNLYIIYMLLFLLLQIISLFGRGTCWGSCCQSCGRQSSFSCFDKLLSSKEMVKQTELLYGELKP